VTATLEGQPVVVLPYEPTYHEGRRLWRVDVGIATGAALWPFLRLSVARYQPEALPGCAQIFPAGLRTRQRLRRLLGNDRMKGACYAPGRAAHALLESPEERLRPFTEDTDHGEHPSLDRQRRR
jgi:hypothetical protein